MELDTKVYQKENNLRLGKLLKDSLTDMYSSRFLAKQLAVRDIKAQYRQSFLGILWMFITPLVTAMIWVFLNNTGTVRISDTGIPYPVYAFSGTLIWSIITEALNSPASSTNGARGIISKINFPKEALILSGIYKLLFNSSIKVILLFLFVIIFGVGFHLSQLLFPLVILGAVLFGTTLGLLITPLSMLYNDISKIVSMGLSFLMYVTPVVYGIPKEGLMKTFMEYNPFTPFIVTARDFVTGGDAAYLFYFFIVLLVCVPIFFLALVIYRISIPVIVERLSA